MEPVPLTLGAESQPEDHQEVPSEVFLSGTLHTPFVSIDSCSFDVRDENFFSLIHQNLATGTMKKQVC